MYVIFLTPIICFQYCLFEKDFFLIINTGHRAFRRRYNPLKMKNNHPHRYSPFRHNHNKIWCLVFFFSLYNLFYHELKICAPALVTWLSWLEHHSALKGLQFNSRSGHILGRRFDPSLRSLWEATNQCSSLPPPHLPSLSLSLSVKINVLKWGDIYTIYVHCFSLLLYNRNFTYHM